jgi:TIR domain
LKIGEEFPNRIEEAIRLYDKLLVILSEHSVRSSWVEDEVRAALEKETQFKREQHPKTVLFPIKIDDAIEQEQAQWVAMMRRKRHIGDCTHWKNHDDY